MSFFKRLFSREPDPREALRPLWHRLVEIAREEHWYAERGVADTMDGRFDMVSLVTSLAILRMEQDPDLIGPSALLTELYVEDMEGQLRESGVGDPVISKHMGKVMSSLGGRIGSLRQALAEGGEATLAAFAERNMTLSERQTGGKLETGIVSLRDDLASTQAADLLAGSILR